MEGRISRHFITIQQRHLEDADSYMNGSDWVKQLITRILQITHSQWIFRNFTLHDKQGGKLQLQEIKQMRSEAVRFSRRNPTELRPESRFLLELDEEQYVTGSSCYNDKCYFLSAARAAMCAGRRKAARGGRTAGSVGKRAATIMKKKFGKGFNKLKTNRQRVVKQVESECREDELPFVAVRCNERKRRVVSGPARMAMMRSNKSYKPGD